MNDYDSVQVSEWLRDGIAAARAGRRDVARELLMQVIDANEKSEQAWLWLSGVVDADEDRLICLENVLTLNPDNVQAKAGVRHLQQRGAGIDRQAKDTPTQAGRETQTPPRKQRTVAPDPEPESFMTPDGCAYCGLTVDERSTRCPHCGKRLTSKRFKHEDRSPQGYLLHAYWLFLIGINVADFLIIGFVWENVDRLSPVIETYLPYLAGKVVTGETALNTFIETETLVLGVRYALLGLAMLGGLVAVGLVLRRTLAHTGGVALLAVHLVLGVVLFVLGFFGYLMAIFRALFTVMLTIFMFNTVEDFAKEERWERLEPDRHLSNDADYYSRGRVYEKRGMWAKALLHWRRAAAMNPNRDTYFAAMARAYAQLGRYEQALAQVDAALRVSRRPEEWHALRQVILEAQIARAEAP